MHASLPELFDRLNQQHFGSALPSPKLIWNSRLRSSAGRFLPPQRSNQHLATIEVASYLQTQPDALWHIQDTLLHEMIHFSLWQQKKPYGHTAEFYKIMKRVGASRYNPVPNLSQIKHWYFCNHCKEKYPARRIWKNVACLSCCKKFNRGKYCEKFRLELLVAPTPPANPHAPAISDILNKNIITEKNKTEAILEEPLPFAELKLRLQKLRESLKLI